MLSLRLLFAAITFLGTGLLAACASTPVAPVGAEPPEEVCRPEWALTAASTAMPERLGAVALSSGHLSDALGNWDGAISGWERQAEAHLEGFDAGHRCWLGLEPDEGELPAEMTVEEVGEAVCDIDCGPGGPVFNRGGCPWAVAIWRTAGGWLPEIAAVDLREDGKGARRALALTGTLAPIGPLPTLESVAAALTVRFGGHCQAPIEQSVQRWAGDIARGQCPLDRVASHDLAVFDPENAASCGLSLALLDLEATRRCRPASEATRVLADYFLSFYSGHTWHGSLDWTFELRVEGWRTPRGAGPDAVAALDVAGRLKQPLTYEHHLHEQLATAWAELPFDLGSDALDGLFRTSEIWDAELLGPAAFVARVKRYVRGDPIPQLRGVAGLNVEEWESLERQLGPKCAAYAMEWELREAAPNE